jgi:hypothetical protein
MNVRFFLLLWFMVSTLYADSWAPSAGLLGAVRHIESADGRFTVGDQGRSLGDYQLSEAAWCDVNAWRKARGLRTYEYNRSVWMESVSRTYAGDYLKILREQLQKRFGRAPTAPELYAAYSMGMSSFAKRHYRVDSIAGMSEGKRLQIQTALLGQ